MTESLKETLEEVWRGPLLNPRHTNRFTICSFRPRDRSIGKFVCGSLYVKKGFNLSPKKKRWRR